MNIHASLILLQASSPNATGLILFQVLAVIAIFYFLLIRPQQKERQRHDTMIAALGKGDEVVTNGGVIGTIVHAADDRVTIRSGEGTRLVVQRARIAQRLGGKDDKTDESAAKGAKEGGR